MEKESINQLIAARFKDARLKRELTFEQLSELSGLSVQTIKKAESGKSSCYAWTIYYLCQALEITPNYLYGTPEESLDEEFKILIGSLNKKHKRFAKMLLYAIKVFQTDLN